jgi:hypothetical protein
MEHSNGELEIEFTKRTMIEALRARHAARDMNGLLEYALLIVEDNHCAKLRMKFLERELRDFIVGNLRQNLPPTSTAIEPSQG